MKSGDCTDTIRATASRPVTVHAIALPWFAGRQLAGLNDSMLRDIGLTRADVAGETRKPFWRP